MRKILLASVATAILISGSAVVAETKIGVVDIAKIMTESPQFAAAQSGFKKQFEPREKEIVDAQKKFQSTIEAFTKNSPTMKADAKEAEQRKIIEQQKKLQQMQEKFQKDVTDARNKVMVDISKNAQAVINKIAEEQKFDLVITKDSVPFSKKELNVTEDVIKKMKGNKASALDTIFGKKEMNATADIAKDGATIVSKPAASVATGETAKSNK